MRVAGSADNRVLKDFWDQSGNGSTNVKPIAGTDSGQAHHLCYGVPGRMVVRHNYGKEMQVRRGGPRVAARGDVEGAASS